MNCTRVSGPSIARRCRIDIWTLKLWPGATNWHFVPSMAASSVFHLAIHARDAPSLRWLLTFFVMFMKDLFYFNLSRIDRRFWRVCICILRLIDYLWCGLSSRWRLISCCEECNMQQYWFGVWRNQCTTVSNSSQIHPRFHIRAMAASLLSCHALPLRQLHWNYGVEKNLFYDIMGNL